MRRTYSLEFKQKVVDEFLKGKMTRSEVAEFYGVERHMSNIWICLHLKGLPLPGERKLLSIKMKDGRTLSTVELAAESGIKEVSAYKRISAYDKKEISYEQATVYKQEIKKKRKKRKKKNAEICVGNPIALVEFRKDNPPGTRDDDIIEKYYPPLPST